MAIRNWRVTVLISGTGSNLQAILDALPSTLNNCTVVSVISSKPAVKGLDRATSHDPPIPISALSLVQFKDAHPELPKHRAAYELELASRVRATRPDLVVLAGFMVILGGPTLEALVRDWDESEVNDAEGLKTEGSTPYAAGDPAVKKGSRIPIINLHPALPKTFIGAHVILDAWNAFQRKEIDKTGLMIHRVIPELDAGEPVLVREVDMKEGESLDQLEERIHEVEHVAIVDAVALVVKALGEGTWSKAE